MAEGSEQAGQGLAQLEGFASVLASEPAAGQILMNPVIPHEQRERFIQQIADVLGLDSRVRRLISLLVDRRRVAILDEVIQIYQQMLDDQNGIVRAIVTSATPLTESEEAEISQRLEKSLGKRVIMDVQQDMAILGGVVVRIGGTVYDGSVRQHLAGFKSRLVAS
jgi:F-type H+-transporting ATPase subunit delta